MVKLVSVWKGKKSLMLAAKDKADNVPQSFPTTNSESTFSSHRMDLGMLIAVFYVSKIESTPINRNPFQDRVCQIHRNLEPKAARASFYPG